MCRERPRVTMLRCCYYCGRVRFERNFDFDIEILCALCAESYVFCLLRCPFGGGAVAAAATIVVVVVYFDVRLLTLDCDFDFGADFNGDCDVGTECWRRKATKAVMLLITHSEIHTVAVAVATPLHKPLLLRVLFAAL